FSSSEAVVRFPAPHFERTPYETHNSGRAAMPGSGLTFSGSQRQQRPPQTQNHNLKENHVQKHPVCRWFHQPCQAHPRGLLTSRRNQKMKPIWLVFALSLLCGG